MLPTQQVRLQRISFCIADLGDNGISLTQIHDRKLQKLVRQYVDYFQLMLGYDSDAEEIIALLKARRDSDAPESERKKD